jgi:hypothetical protein
MLRLRCRPLAHCLCLWLLFSLVADFTWAQSETATVSGQVVDPSGLNLTGAHVKLVDIDRDTSTNTKTNNAGLYTFPSVKPGRYRMEVSVTGFRVVNVTGLTVNVQDHLEQNFKLVIGSISESISVDAGSSLVDTESAAVSTVIDRQFAENLPMNGRSFQTLIQLTPGVVLTPNNGTDSGQFSVNGQRATSNYWMVDGVSGNIGASATNVPGNGVAGTLGSFSVLGGTNSLVSVDALQEFRIQTSTYAPEFGRTPGAQISIVTRSGTNQFHGTLFDYFRNDVLDANNWFNGYINDPPLPKAEERQNDFGGTLSGPILKNRTFFFFSYEGLRLRLPQTTLTTVPDVAARQDAISALQPYLDAFPLPNGPEASGVPGAAEFNASYSNPASLDAYSLRIDHKLGDQLTFFGRYNYSPSKIVQRGNCCALSTVSPANITTQTATVGSTWLISPTMGNDLRFNYSRTSAVSSYREDHFGGASPLSDLQFPSPYTQGNAQLDFQIYSLTNGSLLQGVVAKNLQRQINVVDSLAVQRGSHSLKVGVDFRRLTPVYIPESYGQNAYFADVPSSDSGSLTYGFVTSGRGTTLLLRNLGLFAQDTWRVVPRLSLTYGLRWDVDFAPSSLNGPNIPAVTGYDLNNLAALVLAPAGTPPFRTTYRNVAPRLGVSYRLSDKADWERTVRGGAGVFYDLAGSEVGNLLIQGYPFRALNANVGTSFPFPPSIAVPPPIVPPGGGSGTLAAFDPNLKLPYTLEWNVAFEQGLGKQQTVSASYIGSAGKRLIQTAYIFSPPNYGSLDLIGNTANSDYNALQLQFQRRLSRGLQALVSYTWSHSIDTASAGSYGNAANNVVSGLNASANRGSSDFDIRHAVAAGVTYNLPSPKMNTVARELLHGWSVENAIQARSAQPVEIVDGHFFEEFQGGYYTDVRPDVIPGQPLYLYGSQYPGRKAFNPAAFTDPPSDPDGFPLRQGTLARNGLRGFGAFQWDFASHREFPIHERLKLQFRAEMFNVLNHPNFGPPSGFPGATFGFPGFGVSSQMLGTSLAGPGGLGGGAFNPLYQIGGPRSIQFALKLEF